MKKLSLLMMLLMVASVSSFALLNEPSYQVRPLSYFVADYRAKFQVIKGAIDDLPPTTPIAERLALLNSEMDKLKKQFRQERVAEYESKTYSGSVLNWCTSKSSGGKKKCGTRFTYAPISDLYTTLAWCSVKGTNKGIVVDADGRRAGLKMSVAGKGKNKGTLTALFKYHPSSIQANVDREIGELFGAIV